MPSRLELSLDVNGTAVGAGIPAEAIEPVIVVIIARVVRGAGMWPGLVGVQLGLPMAL